MEDNWNLSNKIVLTSNRSCFLALDIVDVKEFIRRLKEEIKQNTSLEINEKGLFMIIDKLAGSKLIENNGGLIVNDKINFRVLH